MRVGLVVFANKWTGAGAVAGLCCHALRAVGVEARLLFVGGRNLERRLAGRSWALPGLAKERLPGRIRQNLRALRDLAEESELVVCHLPHDHLLCVAAGVHRRVPLVRAFRNPRHIRRDPYHRFLDRSLAAALLAHSTLEDALRRTGHRLPAVALPVPLEDRFRPAEGSGWRRRLGIPPAAPVVGAVGKLAKGRGFELFLEAASRLETSAHVVVAGHGELQPRLQGLATGLGLEHRVHWAGYQDELLPELYAAMDVVLFTTPGSDWGHRAVSEAQGCARPVVAASQAGVEDLINDGVDGRIVTRHPIALAAAVDALIEDPGMARRLGAAAAAAAADRRMKPVGTSLSGFLEQILATERLHSTDEAP